VFQGDVLSKTSMTNSRYRMSLPVDNPTKSFWLDTPGANPLADEGSIGPLTHEADVCIIGSGITGVSAAWHLSKMLEKEDLATRGSRMRVVILEAREFCTFPVFIFVHKASLFNICYLVLLPGSGATGTSTQRYSDVTSIFMLYLQEGTAAT